MGYARVFSRAAVGMAAPLVTVEVHLSGGLPQFQIVGLPETAVRESRERVRGALVNSRFEFPASRITVNLRPADLPKHGGRFDLAIAVGILAASGQVRDTGLAMFECLGELTLAGQLAPVSGVLPACLQIREQRRALLVPPANAAEAALVDGLSVYCAESLGDVAAIVNGEPDALTPPPPLPASQPDSTALDLADVRGQDSAKRALVIAAAGAHNLILIGPPGAGKSMLASRLPVLLPPMTSDEALECAAVASLRAAPFDVGVLHKRPFRSPHHSASAVALIGGGTRPQPGEVSRAHHGVLFLDELPEFSRHVLEMLREPLETGEVHVARAAFTATYPAQFQLVAAMNPCPCGFAGDPQQQCRCSSDQLLRYRRRLSGPLLDRLDLSVTVERLSFAALMDTPASISTAALAETVAIARTRAVERQGYANARIPAQDLPAAIACRHDALSLLSESAQHWHLSARSCHRILRVARTIADLADSDVIEGAHMAESLALRQGLAEPGRASI
ncbi:MAG: YifB family Mg chelatase-like AAA ATPase [Pseudomonadota bacterium]